MIAEARITWPTVRRKKFISRITVATIFTDAIESAVPRKSEVMRRLPGSGSMESGSASPSATQNANRVVMVASDEMIDEPRVRHTAFGTVLKIVRVKWSTARGSGIA